MISRAFILNLCLALAGFAIAYLARGLTFVAIALFFLVLTWGFGERSGWKWVTNVGLVGLLAAAAAGTFLNANLFLLLLGTVCTLNAWDLANFRGRLKHGKENEELRNLERRHLTWLLGVTGISLLLSGAALALHIRLNLAAAIFLGIMCVIGIGQFVRQSFRGKT